MPSNYYEQSLEHIARPAVPEERIEATSMAVQDWVAIWLARELRDYASYVADDPNETIALGMAEYINMVVREESDELVPLYIHTDAAAETLTELAERMEATNLSSVTPREQALTVIDGITNTFEGDGDV